MIQTFVNSNNKQIKQILLRIDSSRTVQLDNMFLKKYYSISRDIINKRFSITIFYYFPFFLNDFINF